MSRFHTILVVDDDPAQAQEIAETLTAARYAVRTASTGDDALAELLSDPPSLAIIDCHLPGRSGLSVMRLALGAGRCTPFVVITGQPDLPDGAAGLSNAVRFLRKPLDLRALLGVVDSLIRQAGSSAA